MTNISRTRCRMVTLSGLLLVGAGLLIRGLSVTALAFSSPETRQDISVQADSWGYRRLGEDLLESPQDSASKRLPFYALFLGASGGMDDDGIVPTVLIQQLVDIVTAILVGACAARFDRRAFLPAAGLLLLVPAGIIHSLMVLPESFLVLACAGSGYLWIRAVQSENPRSRMLFCCATGAALALGTAVKPVVGLAWTVYAALILSRRVFRWKTRLVLLTLLVVYAGSFGWAWRAYNLRNFGLDAISTQTVRDPFERVLILSGEASWDREERNPQIMEISLPALTDEGWDWEMRDSIYGSRMRSLILEHPLRIIIPHLTSWPGFFKPGTKYFEDTPLFSSSPAAFLSLQGVSTLLTLAMAALFAAAALKRSLRARAGPLIWMGLSWFVFSTLVSGPAARAPRYALTFLWSFAAAGGIFIASLAGGNGSPEKNGEG